MVLGSLYSRRALVGGAALVMSLLTGSVAAHTASASISFCRADPVVILSDGTTVRLTADVHDAASDVRRIAYMLRAPKGTRVHAVSYPSPGVRIQETFRFIAGNAPHAYDSDVVVLTGLHPVAVKVTTTVQPSPGRLKKSESKSGHDRQDLRVHLTS